MKKETVAKIRKFWNKYGVPAIEFIGYTLLTILMVAIAALLVILTIIAL